MKPKILVIGAGFAGVFAAKKLYELFMDDADITLVSPSPHFEFHASLYRVVSDRSPLQACFSLQQIFNKTNVQIVTDYIINFDNKNNVANGESGAIYHFDYAVLTLGSENSFFGIKGVSNYSHSMRTIDEALRLSRHIHDVLQEKADTNDKSTTEIIIVGGGPTGVELSGELAVHAANLATIHGLDKQSIQIKLVEAQDHILNILAPQESKDIQDRLKMLGVNIEQRSAVTEELQTGLIVNSLVEKTTTVIWTAGVKASSKYQKWNFATNKIGRVSVNQYLQSKENSSVYIAGDGADLPDSGTAWPAIDQGETAAINIYNDFDKQKLLQYKPKKYPIIIPVGPDWAYIKFPNGLKVTGQIGWYFRQAYILKFFNRLLPLSEALAALKSGGEICSICKQCNDYDQKV
jgi:NADH dehydrogenase